MNKRNKVYKWSLTLRKINMLDSTIYIGSASLWQKIIGSQFYYEDNNLD